MKRMRVAIAIGIALSASGCGVAPEPGDPGSGTGDPADPGNPGDPGKPGDPGGPGPGQGTIDAGVTTPPAAGTGPYFTTPMFFNQDVSTTPKAANSASIIAALAAAGGWGNSNTMQVDFGLDVLTAPAGSPMRTFTPTVDFYTPDCDLTAVPVPAGGNIESETGYACTGDGDCHLLVFDPAANKLYEMYRANITTTFLGGCLAVWDGRKTYSATLRGNQCTSADAAGFPIAPLLFTADEVKAGHIDHAIRFILPNNRIKRGFVRPATHGTDTTGGASAPSYGVHFRLRADYPIASLKPGAQVVARAMQKYGMYHADGGNIALTAQSDRHTTAKWSGLLAPRDLAALQVTDFEVIDHGAPITLTYDCVR
jgi:serine/threonine-protein kinase